MQCFLAVLEQWREEIFDHTSCACFNLHSNGHAGGEVDQAIIDLHLCFVECNAGYIDQLLTFGLAGFVFGTGFFLVLQMRVAAFAVVMASCETERIFPWIKPYLVKLKVSTLISTSCPS